MANESSRNIRLGIFVLAGTLFIIIALYFIGNKQNLFGSTVRISAQFYNVNGLMKGNNVRFAGIDVGTVESVEIINDTAVNVTMIIEEEPCRFIKKNAIASVGTDGLMGNKLVNINSSKDPAEPVVEGDRLQTLRPLEMEEMVRTLNITNENVKVITTNLRHITDKINSKNSLWNLLMDTVIADNIKSSIVNVKLISNQGLLITGNINEVIASIKKGKGSLGALVTDTTLSSKINQVVLKLDKFSDTTAVLTGNISQIVKQMKNGKGTVGVLLNDTMLVHNLNQSVENAKSGTKGFDDNMEALKHTWPFKKYFRKQAKKKAK